MTCDRHSGVTWFMNGQPEAPCFVCTPDWWVEHCPPRVGGTEPGAPVADIVREFHQTAR